MQPDEQDLALLIRDKYAGDASRVTGEDRARLTSGEPLAYVIGWIPFLGLTIHLDSRPLIPRPETEQWALEVIEHLKRRFGKREFRVLDMCAGSGAIGLALLAKLPGAQVSFGELMPAHVEQIRKNIEVNGLDDRRTIVKRANLFLPFLGEKFDVIVTNPPYIPEERELPPEVRDFEPKEALYAGTDGLAIIRIIAREAGAHLSPGGELWMECDIDTITRARDLLLEHGANATEIRTDQYGRSRVVVGYYP